MTETKQFPLRVLLTVTTDRLLTEPKGERDNGIGDLYAILGWMTNDSPMTHQLPRFNNECTPWLLRWFPELAAAQESLAILDADMHREGAARGVELWLGKLELTGMKPTYDVPRIPADDHEQKNAFDELVQMRGSDEGIFLVNHETGEVSQ
jgi:hypothetical protein